MPGPDRLSLHLASLAPLDLSEAAAVAARTGFAAAALDLAHLIKDGPKAAGRLLRDQGLHVTSLGGAGSFTARERDRRRERRDLNLRALEAAQNLGADCLALASGGLPEGSNDLFGAREMVLDGLGELLEDASSAGVRLALVPDHPMRAASHGVVCSVPGALDLAAKLAHDGVGILCDIQRHWWDHALAAHIAQAQRERRLFGLRLGDWLPNVLDPLKERGFPGEGIIPIKAFVDAAEGYDRPLELHVTPGDGLRRWAPRELAMLAAEAAERLG